MNPTAVVILNFNGEKLLPKFLPSVIRYSGEASVIVADNGSTDNSVSLLRREFPTVQIIELGSNYGFCGGYNRALQRIEAPYYVLLNSDVEVTEGWLTPMVNLLDGHPRIGAVQPKILSFEQRHLFEYAGAAGGAIDSLGYPFCRGRIFDAVEEDQGQYDDETQIFWASGACLMIRSELYHRFGGFDEDFFAHMEEIDLCWKIQRSGFEVWACGRSTVYHLGAGTLGYGNPRKTYLNFRNGLSLIYKHFDGGELWFKFPVRVMLDWIAALAHLVKGRGSHAWAVLQAHADFLRLARKNSRKRRALRTAYPDYSREAIYPGSVLTAYFIGKKRTYKGIFNSPR